MKITTFNPMIVSPKGDDIVALFEALGFEKRHEVINVDGHDTTSIRMKNADGFCVDVASVSMLPQDMPMIRMNVDNFDETIKKLEEHGFKSYQGNSPVDTGSSTVTLMKSPSGFSISVSEHKK
jgi:hypothetical protein